MRNIIDIYNEYKIMPNLQQHQLRVAAVAKKVCESLDIPVDTQSVVTACVLHDMGNIIKFRLERFPEFNKPEGIEYWQKVQGEYLATYGQDEHAASIAIAQKLGVSAHIIQNMEAIEFPLWSHVDTYGTFEEKICVYADSRVAPWGIVSLEERLEDGTRRYAGMNPEVDAQREDLHEHIRHIEKTIFSHTTIKPEDITDVSSVEIIETLKSFSL
jgi:hypothetical protein